VHVGLIRITVLLLMAAGACRAYLSGELEPLGLRILGAFYTLGLGSSVLYLLALWRRQEAKAVLTWAQVLMDLGVVAGTVGFTGGSASPFVFLFVVVTLEAGLLLGLAHGYVFATIATALTCVNTAIHLGQVPGETTSEGLVDMVYNMLIQGFAFYLTAAISGYWNQRVTRMQLFQREILDNMNNGFLIADRNGIVSAQNRAATAILQLQEGEALDQPIQEILCVQSDSECPVLTALRTERDFTSYEFHASMKDGTVKLLGLSTSCIYDSRHRLTGIIASFADLTELDQMRAELQRQDRLAVIGELAAGLAHEIRNPVAAIHGAVDELRANIESPDLVSRLAGLAMRESEHLNSIVTNFLDFAREPNIARETFDICSLVREVVDLLRQQSRGEALRVDMHLPDEAYAVSGTRSQLKQVFVNIAVNAVEAMEGQGNLTIAVIPGASSVEVRFDDEGPGIEPDKVARIFEPFYTTKERGVGMGLAVCQRIVTAHDGIIRASSRTTGGTSMSVRLPAVQPTEE